MSLGTQLFFLAQTQIHNKHYEAAHESLAEAAGTHFVDKRHNAHILHFAWAKLYQCRGMHEAAIAAFNKAIDLSEPKSSHCYFRRAWSYKVSFQILKFRNGPRFRCSSVKIMSVSFCLFTVGYFVPFRVITGAGRLCSRGR